MGFSNSCKNRRRKNKNGRDEDSHVNADNIPNTREIVQRMKEIVNCSEQEIYTMLTECNMDADEAVNRLLSQAKDTPESVLTSLQQLSIENDEPITSVKELEHLRFGSVMNGSSQPNDLPSQFLNHLSLLIEKEEERISRNVADELRAYEMNANDEPKSSVKELEHSRFGSGMHGSGQPIGLSSRYLNDLKLIKEEHQRIMRNVANELRAFQMNSNDEPKTSVKELEHLRFGSGMNGFGQPNGLPSQFLNDLSLIEEEERRLRRNVASNSNAASNYHSSSNYDQTEPTQENQNKSSSATDFTFDNSQLFNPMMAPSEPSLQRQNFNTLPNAMHQQEFLRDLGHLISATVNEAMASIKPHMKQQAMNQQPYTREPDPQNSASSLNQSMPTASSHGRRPSACDIESLVLASINKPQMNGQAMNQHAYTREPNPQYSASALNQSMPTATSHGRRSSSASEIDALLQQSINQQAYKREPDLPQSVAHVVPSANGSAYGFGLSSDNAANSRFGSDDVPRSQLSNHLPSFQHQNRNSNVLAPQGNQNEQSQSLRHSQQQEQEQEQQPYRGSGNGTERSRRYQRNNRRNSSNQTQQKTWRRRNNN